MKHTRVTAASSTPVLSRRTVLSLLAGITAGLGGALPAQGADLVFIEHTISVNAGRATSVFAADLDGDQDIDVIGGSLDVEWLAWYENNGDSPLTFTVHEIAPTLTFSTFSVFAKDVDGDGKTDILAAHAAGDHVAWYENDCGSPPDFANLDNRHLILPPQNGPHSVFAADVNGDGHMDILSAHQAAIPSYEKIAWFENDGMSPPSFTEHALWEENSGGSAEDVFGVDLDGDGDIDVLAAFGTSTNKIRWWENDGMLNPTWIEREIETTGTRPVSVFAAYINDDMLIDFVSASHTNDQIAWFENNGDSPLTFTEHVIDNITVEGASSVFAKDVDLDGDTDILFASSLDNRIGWAENNGDSPLTFTEHVLPFTIVNAESVFAEDVDDDGDIDFLAAAFGFGQTGKITWYENVCNNNGVVEFNEECDGGIGCTQCACDTGYVPRVPPALDCMNLVPPKRAPSPHDILKNRYISVDPSPGGINPDAHHIRVMVDSSQVIGQTGNGPWWANDPVSGNPPSPATCISVVTTAKPAMVPNWSKCDEVHLTGCPIIPTTTYAIAAESEGSLSEDELLDTQAKPGVNWHGDCVGSFSGPPNNEWSAPNGVVNADDIVAAIRTFQDPDGLLATHLSVTDVHPNLPPLHPNRTVNFNDVLVIVDGFEGEEYPGPDLTECP